MLPENVSLPAMSKATPAAPPVRGRHPVLLLSHGLGGTTAFHTAQATDLASHGYVVVGIDLPGDATFVDVGGGRVVPQNPNGEDYIRELAVDARIAEMRSVVDQIQRLRGTGLIDVNRVGVFGHSLGASATAGALQADRRLRAGVMLDGLALPPVAERGYPNTAIYSLVKGAIVTLTKTLATELGPRRVRVNAVAPGSVPTPGAMGLNDEAEYARRARTIPLRRLGREADNAEAVAWLLSPEAAFINGEILHVDGGIAAAG